MRIVKKIAGSGLIWLWVAVLLMTIDRLTKLWAVAHLMPYESLAIFPFFNLTLAYNTGAAFSFLHSASGWQNMVFGGLAGIISVIILIWLYRLSFRERWLSIGLCLILGGALGNAWDRLSFGYVVDFLDFHMGDWHFAIFNVADSAICVGAAMLFLHWLVYPSYASSR